METREMDKRPPVILISANAEWEAARGILKPAKTFNTPFGETFEQGGLIFFHGGWGKISAAASTQFTIDHYQPGLLVNIGTCGGFSGRVARGTVILVDKTIVYDIFEQMSDPQEAIEAYSTELDLTWLKELPPHPVQRGLLVSADRDIVKDDIPMLVEKYGAVAADWESGAIAWVAKRNGVKCLILRGVSDLVSSDGGEAYGNIDLFHANTQGIMRILIKQLPDWLEQAQNRL
jgi:adenosylhomocysteine nucleosidase